MAITESKLKTGKLTLGTAPGTEFSCQATNVRIAPSFNDSGDPVETLCGDTLTASTTSSFNLQGTSIQDFDNTAGFVQYTWDNNLMTVDFTWQPNTNATTFSGQCQIRAVEVGGDVNTRLTTDFDWPISGTPTTVWPAMAAASDSDSASNDKVSTVTTAKK